MGSLQKLESSGAILEKIFFLLYQQVKLVEERVRGRISLTMTWVPCRPDHFSPESLRQRSLIMISFLGKEYVLDPVLISPPMFSWGSLHPKKRVLWLPKATLPRVEDKL